MTFLSKIGGILLKGIAIAGGFTQVIGQQVPQAGGVVQASQGFLAKIAEVVMTVEALGQLKSLPGAEKAKAAGPLVAQIILRSTLVAGQKISDPVLFNQGCTNIAGGVADVLNSLSSDGANEIKP